GGRSGGVVDRRLGRTPALRLRGHRPRGGARPEGPRQQWRRRRQLAVEVVGGVEGGRPAWLSALGGFRRRLFTGHRRRPDRGPAPAGVSVWCSAGWAFERGGGAAGLAAGASGVATVAPAVDAVVVALAIGAPTAASILAVAAKSASAPPRRSSSHQPRGKTIA